MVSRNSESILTIIDYSILFLSIEGIVSIGKHEYGIKAVTYKYG